MKTMKKNELLEALVALEKELDRPLKLLVVGGGAMVLAHQLPMATSDIDAVPFKSDWTLDELDRCVKKVAQQLKIQSDWLNPHFTSFSYVLPKDYDQRLVVIYRGLKLDAYALGIEDLLILKCFAGRERDAMHARYLMKRCKNLAWVERHIEGLIQNHIPKAHEAMAFLDEIKDVLDK